MEALVSSSLSNGIGRITLNRPEKRNALTRDFIQQLEQAVSKLGSDDSLRVLVIAAEGTVFCAGMDLAQMQERATSPDSAAAWQKDSEVFCGLLQKLHAVPVPTIVALQGPVLAGGVGIVLACDLVVASDNAFFMLPEPKRGIAAAMVTPLLVHRMGAGLAGQLLLSGEKMSALRAFQIGMCYDVVEPENLSGRVDRLVDSVVTGSRSALMISKQHLANCIDQDLMTQIETSVMVSAEARQTEDAREGLAAFLEKRKPNWQPESG